MADIIKLPMARLADMANADYGDIEDDYIDQHRVGFMVLNPPPCFGMTKGKVTTCFTNPTEARAAATMILDAICRQKGIDPPAFWELRMMSIPPITH